MLRVVHERHEREPVDRPQSGWTRWFRPGAQEMLALRRRGSPRLAAVASALRLEIGVLLGVLPEQESN